MQLASGTTLGQFEITGPLGKGGMGEVYRALDSKLGREVAIKVMPAKVAADAEYLARFEREAISLAALNHPNVASLYGFHHAGGVHFLEMELVEGSTLLEVIARGELTFDETVAIFLQIAEGLEAAHEQGMIHRDLKPANIKITPRGKAKILDFGMAKQSGFARQEPNSSDAPTRPMSPAPGTLTTAGVILGTPNYMSPEQARGRAVDRRTDIWAYGCCLYQALTGEMPFGGDSVADVVASVLQTEPNRNLLPAGLPARVRELLDRCLEKDARFRLRDIGEAWVTLQRPVVNEPAAVQTAAASKEITRFRVDFPRDHYLSYMFAPFAISPAGDAIAVVLYADSKQFLYIRRMDEIEFRRFPGTENARTPYFSPDGKHILFAQKRAIKVVPANGGAVRTLIECKSTPLRAIWTAGEEIIWGELNGPLQKVRADGSNPEVLCELDADKMEHWQSPFCRASDPDWIISNVVTDRGNLSSNLEFVSTRTGERRTINAASGMGAQTAAGLLVFPRESSRDIYAARIADVSDPGACNPVRVIKAVSTDEDGVPQVDVSASGSLVYIPSRERAADSKLYWVTRDGKRSDIEIPPNHYVEPRISPDGRTVALVADDRLGVPQIHLLDCARGVVEKLTSEKRGGVMAVWHPSGNALAYCARETVSRASMKRLGLDDLRAEPIGDCPKSQTASDYSSDGNHLLFVRMNSLLSFSIHAIDETGEESLFVEAAGRCMTPRFHPSGKYVAYISNESGPWEVYVKPFRQPGRRIQVSMNGGSDPVWSRDGTELFYRRDNDLLAVPVHLDDTISFGTEQRLFQFDFAGKVSTFNASYDVHPDGERFIMADAISINRGATGFVVVRNWEEEVYRTHPELRG